MSLEPFLASLVARCDRIIPKLFAGCRLTPVRGGFIGRCPFHRATAHPTLFVADDAPLWRCYAGHEGGDWFTYMAAKEGMVVPETAQALARLAGVPLPDLTGFDETAWRKADRRGLFLWTVEHLFMGRLWTRHGREVVAALMASGVTEQEIVAQRIGMAVAPDEIERYLRKKGVFDPSLFESTGLADGGFGGDYGETVAARDRLGRVVRFGPSIG